MKTMVLSPMQSDYVTRKEFDAFRDEMHDYKLDTDIHLDNIEHCIEASKELMLKGFEKMEQYIDASISNNINALESRVNDKVDSLESRINVKVDSLEFRLNGKIDALDGKLDSIKQELLAAITNTQDY